MRNINDWQFDQAPNVAAITTKQILEDKLPILLVIHYSEDHSWAFLCGTSNKQEDARVMGMGEVIRIDPSINEISDLVPGWKAWRESADSEWHREQMKD